jgi:hypothetical protein
LELLARERLRFARRFIDLPYTGKYGTIIKDCKDTNRRYRVSCCDFYTSRDAETQLSLLVLYEAFKHSIPKKNYSSLLTTFFENHPNSLDIRLEKLCKLLRRHFV